MGRHALERLEPLPRPAVQLRALRRSRLRHAQPRPPPRDGAARGRSWRAVDRDQRRRPATRAVRRRRPGAWLRSLGRGAGTAQRRRDVRRVRHRRLTVARHPAGPVAPRSGLGPSRQSRAPVRTARFALQRRRLGGGRALPVLRFGRRAGERAEGPAAAAAPAESDPDHRRRAPGGRRGSGACAWRDRGTASRSASTRCWRPSSRCSISPKPPTSTLIGCRPPTRGPARAPAPAHLRRPGAGPLCARGAWPGRLRSLECQPAARLRGRATAVDDVLVSRLGARRDRAAGARRPPRPAAVAARAQRRAGTAAVAA